MDRAKNGFTLIEVVLVALLVSLMTGIAILRGARFVDSIEVRGAITEIESLFSLARHIAIARGSQSTLEIDAGNGVLSVRSGGEVIRARDVGEAHGVELVTNRSSMTYSPIGVGYGAANFSLVVRRNAVVDTVIISRLGRIRH
jgi:prepilin-type N-terminal cleavage/methylation domain-containing protein